jgi:UDP-N-acetylglucosamine--N-acetylmuramyl-(pentapeptide) pyrophosphoryl-undecaprenol N-acetylglucosamine transferase
MAGADAARLARSSDVQFVILTGRADRSEAERRAGDTSRVRVLEYLDDVHMAYSIADIAVARSGASSCFELALFGVPSIFVPYPFAADAHQEKNASPLVEAGGALVIGDAELRGENLASTVASLLDDPTRRTAMSKAMRAWSKPNAAQDAARAILEIAKKKEWDAAVDR